MKPAIDGYKETINTIPSTDWIVDVSTALFTSFAPCRYAAGTQPWGTPNVNNTTFEPQKHDDGLLEVIGFTMTALVSWVSFIDSSVILFKYTAAWTPIIVNYSRVF